MIYTGMCVERSLVAWRRAEAVAVFVTVVGDGG